jgi:uncharacterized membrane protein SpoIIM required for sporulation
MAGLTDFVNRRKPGWDRLAAILARSGGGRGVRGLSREDLRALGPLYRRTAADLAYARLRGAEPALVAHLNDLVTRAHGLLYAERGPGGSRLRRFVASGFPALVRARRAYILLAAALFLAGGLIGAGIVAANPDNLRILAPAQAQDPRYYARVEEQQMPENIKSAMYMTHNTQVAIVAFAIGMLGGFPTLYVLFANGLPIGALAVSQARAGYAGAFWAFIFPHGFVELTAIFIAGGAGMLVGKALVAPGELSRRDALVVAGRDAARLLVGVAGLLVVAGIIEGSLSPSRLPREAKITFGFLTLVGLVAYFRGGQPHPRAE